MTESVQQKSDLLGNLPREWPHDLLPFIRERLDASGRKIVVLDDDPTGTQTVHNIPVLTTWPVDVLEKELTRPGPGFFILTNSRSLDRDAACALGTELGARLKEAGQRTGVAPLVISRSDSTLRGYFPHEMDAVAQAMDMPGLPYLIFPFFPEGGRYTLDNIHYVAEGEDLVPAGQTPYARDAAFSYTASDLTQWVAEKTGGKIPAESVTAISLDHIRNGGPEQVRDILIRTGRGSACVVNAVSYRDVEVVAAALFMAMEKGTHFLFRTAAAFVRVMAGITPRPELLSREELAADTPCGGLFLVGSYVPKTTAQVKALTALPGMSGVEVRVERLLEPDHRDDEIQRASRAANTNLAQGHDVVVFTSRSLVTGTDARASLDIGRTVSQSLIRIVRSLDRQPRYLVAKGGITSSDVATKGLDVKRALIMGQVLPGVPVWQLGPESRYPGMSYVVFPGNVGADNALVQIREMLGQGGT